MRLSNGQTYIWQTPARPRSVYGSLDSVVREAPGASWHDPDFSDKPGYLQTLPPLLSADRRALLEVTRQRAEALTVADQQVGRVMKVLAGTGELNRTLVIFTSDNGYFLGEQRMRLGKVFPHEPSLRVPLLMRGPGLPAGSTRRDPFTSIDYLPTIAAATGTTPEQPPDGISLWNVARRGDTGWTRAILTKAGALHQPPRDTNEAGQPLSSGGKQDIRFLLGVRTPRYLYIDVAHQRDELYDLSTDPREYRNLIDVPGYRQTRTLLAQALDSVRACRGASCSVPLPPELTSLRKQGFGRAAPAPPGAAIDVEKPRASSPDGQQSVADPDDHLLVGARVGLVGVGELVPAAVLLPREVFTVLPAGIVEVLVEHHDAAGPQARTHVLQDRHS
jgi:hypothetical protein